MHLCHTQVSELPGSHLFFWHFTASWEPVQEVSDREQRTCHQKKLPSLCQRYMDFFFFFPACTIVFRVQFTSFSELLVVQSISQATLQKLPLHLWFMFLAKYKAPKARHINILEWNTWKYLMDLGKQILWPVTSHSHLPFCEQSVLSCNRQWDLGTTAGVSVSLHALFMREPGFKPSRHWPSTDATVTSAMQGSFWPLTGCVEHIPPAPAFVCCTIASMGSLWNKLSYRDSRSSPGCTLGWCLLSWETNVPSVALWALSL